MNHYCTFKKLFEKECGHEKFIVCFSDFLSYCLNKLSGDHPLGPPFGPYIRVGDEGKRSLYPRMLRELKLFTREESGNPLGNDLLGEFYEEKRGITFIPFPVALAKTHQLMNTGFPGGEGCFFQPDTGSGRTLLAFARQSPKPLTHCGMETNPLFVKLTVINLALNQQQGEVVCADKKAKFFYAYKITQKPQSIQLLHTEEGLEFWPSIRDHVLGKMDSLQEHLTPLLAAKELILPFIMAGATNHLRIARDVQAKEENYTARLENDKVIVESLYGSPIHEEFSLKEVVIEIIADLLKEMHSEWNEI